MLVLPFQQLKTPIHTKQKGSGFEDFHVMKTAWTDHELGLRCLCQTEPTGMLAHLHHLHLMVRCHVQPVYWLYMLRAC